MICSALGAEISDKYIDIGFSVRGIHIMIDRTQRKTVGEAFLEIKTLAGYDAATRRNARTGHVIKIGSTWARIHGSSYQEFMEKLFPFAKQTGVKWHGSKPIPNTVPKGFRGFVNPEDMLQMIKMARDPNNVRGTPLDYECGVANPSI